MKKKQKKGNSYCLLSSTLKIIEFEEDSLVLTEIKSSSEYKSKGEASTSSALSLYTITNEPLTGCDT